VITPAPVSVSIDSNECHDQMDDRIVKHRIVLA